MTRKRFAAAFAYPAGRITRYGIEWPINFESSFASDTFAGSARLTPVRCDMPDTTSEKKIRKIERPFLIFIVLAFGLMDRPHPLPSFLRTPDRAPPFQAVAGPIGNTFERMPFEILLW